MCFSINGNTFKMFGFLKLLHYKKFSCGLWLGEGGQWVRSAWLILWGPGDSWGVASKHHSLLWPLSPLQGL